LDLNADAVAVATLGYAMNIKAVNVVRGKGNSGNAHAAEVTQ
jgi:hypothetical protein